MLVFFLSLFISQVLSWGATTTSPTTSPTKTISRGSSPSATPTVTISPTQTPSGTRTPSQTPSISSTPSMTRSPFPASTSFILYDNTNDASNIGSTAINLWDTNSNTPRSVAFTFFADSSSSLELTNVSVLVGDSATSGARFLNVSLWTASPINFSPISRVSSWRVSNAALVNSNNGFANGQNSLGKYAVFSLDATFLIPVSLSTMAFALVFSCPTSSSGGWPLYRQLSNPSTSSPAIPFPAVSVGSDTSSTPWINSYATGSFQNGRTPGTLFPGGIKIMAKLSVGTKSPTSTASPTPSGTPSNTRTGTGTPSSGTSLSVTPSPSVTSSVSPSASVSSTGTPSPTVTPSFTPSPTRSSSDTPSITNTPGMAPGTKIFVVDTTLSKKGNFDTATLLGGASTACTTNCPAIYTNGNSGNTQYHFAFYIEPHSTFDILLTSITFPLQGSFSTWGGGGGTTYVSTFTADLAYTDESLLPKTAVVTDNNKFTNSTSSNSNRWVTLPLSAVSSTGVLGTPWLVPARGRLPPGSGNWTYYAVILRMTAFSSSQSNTAQNFNRLTSSPTANWGACNFPYWSSKLSTVATWNTPTAGFNVLSGVGISISGVVQALPTPSTTSTCTPTPSTTITGSVTAASTTTTTSTASPTPTYTRTATRTPTYTPTSSETPSNTPSNTASPSLSPSRNTDIVYMSSGSTLTSPQIAGTGVAGFLFLGFLIVFLILRTRRIRRAAPKKAPFASSSAASRPKQGPCGGLCPSTLPCFPKKKGLPGGSPMGKRGAGGVAFSNPALSSPSDIGNPLHASTLSTYAGAGAALGSSSASTSSHGEATVVKLLPFERGDAGEALASAGDDPSGGNLEESPPSQWGIAQFDYAPLQADELSLLPEDRVWVCASEVVEGWSKGRVTDFAGKWKTGKEGLFPSGFVRILSQREANVQGLPLTGPKQVRLVKKMVEMEVEEEIQGGGEEDDKEVEEKEDDEPLPAGWRRKGLKKGASSSNLKGKKKLVFYENIETGAVSYVRPTKPSSSTASLNILSPNE